ncbi:MAG: sensor histidine kinase [Caulobacteraceae bacterium]
MAPGWVGEAMAAVLCLVGAVAIRAALDALALGVPPFILIFPLAAVVTLVGGWRAGLGASLFAEFCAWCYVIPPRGLQFKGEAQPVNLIAIAAGLVVVVTVAQAFRSASRREAKRRAAQLAERDLATRELEHRMRNNLQAIAGVIEMQLRRTVEEPARRALAEALGRVASIGDAHESLYAVGEGLGPVDMAAYLKELCGNLASALMLGEMVRLECRVEPGALTRERAVAVGLIVNELVTNAVKHAFAGGRRGQIRVAFARAPGGYRLTVEDDGSGLPPDFETRPHGLGRGLVEAFARQAGGELSVKDGAPGARFEVDLAA